MRWTYLVLCLTTVLLPAFAAAQTNGRINGSVVSSEGVPLAAAAVTIRMATDSAVIAGALTAADGRFQVTGLAAGHYRVRISLIGYNPLTLPDLVVSAAAPAANAGTVKLVQAPVQLGSVEGSVQRSPVVLEADRTIYNTRELPAVDGGTAADVLRHIDELEVDANGRVTLRGNQSVAIHINGRAAPMKGEQIQEFIRQMPGKAIARVEVMPNPSAKYDPEGMGGIVNIVLRDDAGLGLSGSFGVNVNTRADRGLNSRLAYQHGRLSFFGGGSATLGEHRNNNSDLGRNLLTAPALLRAEQSHHQ